MGIFAGKTSKFRIGSEVVARSVTITPPAPTMGEWDATQLDSTNIVGAPTMVDPGEMGLTFNTDRSESSQALLEDYGTEAAMSIEYAAGVSAKFLNFRGWVKTSSPGDSNPTTYHQGSATIRLVTLPTWGSSAVTS